MESATESPKVDVEGAAQYAGGLSDGVRVFRPRQEAGTWIGAVVIGAVHGIVLVPFLNLALAPAFIQDVFSRGTIGTPTYEKSPINAYILSAVVVVVVRFAWRWFQQKPVEIVIDGEGITETEGGDVRLHIPWRDARGFGQERHYRTRYGQRYVKHEARFAAPSGAMISVTNADDTLLFPDHPMRTVVRNREIVTLLNIARMLPPLDPKARDPRLVDERGAVGLRIVTLIGTAIIGVVGWAALNHFGFGGDQTGFGNVHSFPLPDALIMSAILFVGGALRTIVPLRRFLRMRRREREASAVRAATEAGGGYRAAAKPATDNEPVTKHERLRTQVALGRRLAALLALVILPMLARASVNQHCRSLSPYSPADFCSR